MNEFHMNFKGSVPVPNSIHDPRSLRHIGGVNGTNPAHRRCGFMSEFWKLQADSWALPMLGTISAMLGVGGLFFMALYWLTQPTVYENPGLAAFTPPAATRLVPLPRVSDAPELAELPDLPASPMTALAEAKMTEKPTSEKPAKAVARQAAHKHARVPREVDQRRWGYAQQNYDYRDWNSNRQWGGRTWF